MRSFGQYQLRFALCALFSANLSCCAITNFVTREIRYESGDVVVEDNLHLQRSIWESRFVLQDILKSKEKLDGTAAFQKAVLHLIEGEDLQLMRLTPPQTRASWICRLYRELRWIPTNLQNSTPCVAMWAAGF